MYMLKNFTRNLLLKQRCIALLGGIVFLLIISSFSAMAGVITWSGTTNNNWNTGTNWVGGIAPVAGDDALIPGGLTNYPIINNAVTIRLVTINSSGSGASIIVTTGGVFTATDVITVNANGTFTVNAGTATLGGITTSGAVVVSEGTITSDVNIILNSGATLTQSGGVIHLAGTTGTIPTDNLTINSGATLTQSGGTLAIKDFNTGAGTFNQTGSGALFKVFKNWKPGTGSVFNSTAGTVQFSGNPTGSDFATGTRQFSNVIIDAAVNPEFSGTVAGNIAVSGNFTNNNTALPIQTDIAITLNGTGTQNIYTAAPANCIASSLIINNTGTVSLSSAINVIAFTVNGGAFTTSASNYALTTTGDATFNGGTLNLNNSTVSITGNFSNNGTVITAGTAAITVTGNYTRTDGSFTGPSSTLSVGGNWVNNNASPVSAASVTFTGATKTIGGTVSTAFPALTVLGTLLTMNNSGSCTSLTFPGTGNSIALTLATGITLTVNGDININQPTASDINALNINTATVIVNGNVNIGGTNTSTGRISKIVITTGTLDINGNLVYNSASGVNVTAVIDMSGGAGNVFLSGNMSLTNGSGTLTPGTSSTFTYDGSGSQSVGTGGAISYNSFTINKSAGTATLGAALSVVNLNLLSGTFASAGFALTISGNVLNNGGTMTGSPATIFTGITKTISGTGTTDFGALTFNGGTIYTISSIITATGLTIPVYNGLTTITQTSTGNVTINGNVTIGQPSGNTKTAGWNINAGTATVTGNINIGGINTTVTRISKIAITTGTLNANGNIIYNSPAATPANAVVDMSGGAGWLNLKGSLTLTNGTGTLTPGTSSTVNFNGTLAQTVSFASAIRYYNIYSNNAATVTVSGAVTSTLVTGDIRIQSGVFSNGGYAIAMATSKTFEVVNGATFKLTGTSAMVTGTTIVKTFGASSTVEYAGAAQTVSNELYGHLTLSGSSGAVVKTMPNAVMTIAGNLTSNLGTGTSVSYTALANYTIGGNVTIGASTTFDGSTFTHSLAGNWVNNGTYTVSTSTVTMTGASTTISGLGTLAFNNLTFTGSNITAGAVNISVAGNLSATGVGSFIHGSGGGFTMSGTAKTISGTGFAFNDLTLSGTISTASIITVTGNLTAGGAGSFTSSAGSVTMSGASKTMTATGAISLYNLTVTGTVTTATSFTITAILTVTGSLTASAGTATFTGTSVLNGTANLYNVTINGTSLQLAMNATLGIANTYTISAGSLNVTSTTPNTVNFYGSNPQNIAAGTFHHLILSNGANTAAGVITVNGNFTINTGASFIASSSYYLYVKNNFVNSGTFTHGNGTVQFDGAIDGIITGATTFYNIIVNKSAATNILTLNSNISVGTITMTQGVVSTGTNTLNITTTRTGSGIILGWIQRTHAFTTGVAYEFESPNNSVTFTAASGLTSVLVKVTKGAIGDFPFGGSINRLYDITIPAGTYTATLRLHYEDAELNGNTESSIKLWKYSGSWITAGKSNNSTTNNWVEQTGLTNMATRWTCSDDNNVMSWNGSVSSNWNTAANWSAVQGAPGSVPSSNDIVQIGISAFTNAPDISTAAVAKSITFGSAQAATLTLNAGGSLTTQGNISGNWSGNATHTINANNQNITVNGDIVLSDGTTNHAINLNIGTGTVTMTGSLTESGGANITFSGSGALVIGNNFTYASGTFTKSTGTVTFNGAGAQAVAAVNYHNLVINKTGIASISSATTVSGDLTITAGELDINAASTITGNVSIAPGATLASGTVNNSVGGNWSNSGTFIPNSGMITLNGSSTQTISAGTFNNFTINKSAGTAILGNVTINGSVSLLSGTLDLSTFTLNRNTLGGSFSMSNGTTLYLAGAANFPANYTTYTLGATSTVNYNGVVAQSVAGITYGNLVFSNGTSNAKSLTAATTVNGDLTVNSGATFSAGSYILSIAGNWTNSGTFTSSTSTVVLSGTTKTINGNTTFNKLTVSGSYSVPGNDLTMNGLLYIPTGGSVASTTGTLTLHGDVTNNGTITSTGTTTFTGTVAQAIQLTNCTTTLNVINFNGTVAPTALSTSSPTFATVNINNTGGITSSVGWTVTTAFNVAVGASFNGYSVTHNFNGSFTNNGTVSTSGTINFNPSATQTIKLAGTSFSSTGTVVFGGSGAITVTGTPATLTNITISNTTGVTPSANWTMGGNFLVNSNGIFNAGTYSYSVGGDLLSSGTINAGTSTFTMTSGAGTLSGSTTTTFYDLVISGTVTATADYNVSHNFTNNGSYNGTAAVLNITGSTASIIGGTAVTYNLAQLSIQKTGGAATTLARNILAVTSLDVTTGILVASTYTITQDAAGGAFSLLANSTFKIGGTNTLPTFTTYSFDSLSTVEYNGGVQSVSAATSYGNLVMSTAGNKTAAAALTIQKNLTLTNATFIGGAYTHLVGGNWNMSSGAFTNTGTTISLNGTMTQTVTSTGAFNNLTVNKASAGVSLGGNITFSGTLTFTSGIITTGSYSVITTTGIVSGAAQGTGWINGNLQRSLANGSPVAATYQVGGAAYYTPATLTFASVTGGGGAVTVAGKDGAHPNLAAGSITADKNIPRYWTVTNTGSILFTTYTISLTWNTAENYASLTTALLTVGKYTTGTWSYPTVTGTPTTSNIQANAITNMGDFVAGEKCDVPATFSYVASPFCSNTGTASVTYNNGGQAGTFSSTAGLSLNTLTGAVNTAASIAGTYTVTNTTTGTGGCNTSSTATITITSSPSATISYTGSPYCTSAGTATVTRSGTAGGTYSSTAGLSINATTGAITTGTSTAGTYTVTYTVAAAGGCSLYTATTSVTITAAPAATISYAGSPYCSDGATASVTFSGTTGGTYSSTAGLSINATTGAVTLSTSTEGTYTVTYTKAAGGGCSLYTTTASITINTSGKWSGAANTSWTNTANWQCGIVPNAATNVIIPAGLTNYPTISSGTAAVNDISIASGASLSLTGGTLQVAGAVTNSGTFTASAGTVEMNGTSQTIAANTYNNLLLSGSGTKTAAGALVVNGTLTINSGVTMDMVSYDLGGTLATVTSSGTIKTQSATATPVASGKTWTGAVEYNKTTGGQTIVAGTYTNLTNSNTSGTNTAAAALSVSGTLTLNASSTFDMATYALSGSLSTITGTGTFKTQNSSATPVPSGKTWTGPVYYNSGSAQKIVLANYADLDASGGNRSFDTTSTISIAGSFTPGGGTYTITGSKIDFNSSGAQSVPAFTFHNVTVSGGNTKSIAGNISVKNVLFLGDNTTLALGNNFITLKSDSTNTASIGAVPATAAITYGTGAFTVERYVIGRRKYRMITSSVTTSPNAILTVGEESKSIWGMWQNSGNNVTANQGTIITGGSVANGFDPHTTTASMYTYDAVTRTFKAFSTANGKNTKYTPLKAGRPYYLFVYGDRTNTITTSSPKNTTLTATGTVLTGNQVYDSTSAVPISTTVDQYSLVGNPYASTIDWKTVTKSSVSKTIWAWDPNLNAQGGYVTVTDMLNGILIAPLSGAVRISQYIQPGQAFFVKTSGTNPKVTIKESDKVNSTTNGVFLTTTANPLMAVNMLYPSGATTLLADGAVVAFDPAYSNNITDDDVKKYPGSTEVVSILKSGSLLSVETTKFPATGDTMFLNMQRLTKPVYTLEIFAQDIGIGIFKATLVDKFLNTKQLLSLTDTNRIPVLRTTNPLSYAADRFLIVFENLSVLPVTFTSVKAMRQSDNKIRVDWSVENQVNINNYTIQRSADGVNFTAIGIQAANTDVTGNYSFIDVKPLSGDNFYRIKSTGNDGWVNYSVIVKVKTEAGEQKMSVYPNPITGGELNVFMENIVAGNYTIRVINFNGNTITTKQIKHTGGNQTHTINVAGLAAGNYFVELIQPVNTRLVYKVIKL